MITLQERPKAVKVGHWHMENAKWENGICVKPTVKEVRFDNPDKDYVGLLHGFGVEGESAEMYAFALVEKEDGTFDTPSVAVIQLISPTRL